MNATWNIRHGAWWMIQWCRDGWLSLGVHADLRRRHAQRPDGRTVTYGPYVDMHIGWLILSVGNHPLYAGDLEASTSVARGGRAVSAWRP